MKMKKLLCAALAALMVLALAACGEAPAEESEALSLLSSSAFSMDLAR